MYVCMYGWMYGWMYGLMNGWMDGWVVYVTVIHPFVASDIAVGG